MPLGTLPKSGKKLWESVYNEAKASGDSKETAAQKAWGAVKNGWKKKDGKWVKKSELIQSFSMFISKATKDGKVMRWQAVNSDTDPDSHAERMSLDLYQDFISHIENKDPIPEVFRSAVCSKWWCGGNPYVSVSHYLDLDGKAVPGEPTHVFVDGNKLKAKGVLYDTPLGHATYRSLVSDKDKSPENKIRISIGFLDLAHKHGENGSVWIRESTTSVCPECFDGVGDKIYVRGYLVHLAMTRVPVNKRTQMVLEEKSEMSKKIPTRKEDAASIVGEDLANQIDAVSKSTVMDSNALVEMSEEPTEEETQELVAEVEKTEEPTVLASTTDPRGYTETKSKAKDKPEDEEDDEEDDKEEGKVEKKSEVPPVEEKAESPSDSPDDVISIKNAATAITKAIDELKSALAEFSQASATVNNTTVSKSENAHALKPALDAILASVDNSITIEGDLNAKLQFVQPSINELGQAIMDYVQTKSIVSEEKEPAAQNKDNLIDDIKKLIQPVVDEIGSLKSEVGILKAQQKVENVQPQSRIPQPRTRTISPNLTAKSEEKPKSSIRSIVNKSVGLPENS